MPKRNSRFLVVQCFLVLSLCTLLCGCIGATRLPVRVVNPAGTRIHPKEIDLTFLQVGATQRDEVAHQLAAIDTSYDNPRLFWGRWSESRWGYWWVLGWPCDNCMAGDAGRLWRMKNLLVDFDENGALSSREVIPDDKLWKALRAHISGIQPPTLDLSKPVRIVLTSPDPIAIQMDPNYMEFERAEDSGKPNVQVAVRNVMRFKHNGDGADANSASITCHTLELSEKTVLGKKIRFCSDAAQIGILFEYLQQSASATMRWE